MICPNIEFLWSVFSYVWTEREDLLRRFTYSVRIRENTDRKKRHIQIFFTQCNCISSSRNLKKFFRESWMKYLNLLNDLLTTYLLQTLEKTESYYSFVVLGRHLPLFYQDNGSSERKTFGIRNYQWFNEISANNFNTTIAWCNLSSIVCEVIATVFFFHITYFKPKIHKKIASN